MTLLRRAPLPAALAHLGLALLVTAPILIRPFDHLVGSPYVDVWNHAWGPWWWFASLSEGAIPWHNRYLAWPAGGSLWFIDPVLSLVGAPLVPILGVAAAWNAVIIGYVAMASWAGRRFALALGATRATSWIGAAGVAASAWMACEIHNGISEAIDIWPVALALAWVEEAVQHGPKGGLRAWAKAGLGVGLAAVASPYLGLAAGLAALVRGLPDLRRAWVGALVAALVAAPPALALRAQLHAEDAIIKHPEGMNEQLALHNAVDPRTFVQPFGFRSVDLSNEGFEHSMYLGLGLLVLAAIALREAHREIVDDPGRGRRWWALAALVCFVFSLGPFLYWGDGWADLFGRRFRMPWWLIQQIAPGLAVTHPLRLAVPVLVIAAGLAAVGARRFVHVRAAPALVALVLLDGLVLSGAPWPQQTADASPPAVYAGMERPLGVPSTEAVLDLPTDSGYTMAASRYLIYQAVAHHRPIPYGPDVRASTSSLIGEPAFRRLAALCERRSDEHQRLGFGSAVETARIKQLQRLGIRWIIVHRDLGRDAADRLETLIGSELGPGEVIGEAVRWDLGRAPR